MKEQIKELINKELSYIYCNNCRFEILSEKEANFLFGYYGCDDCHRKNIGWELSDENIEALSNNILKLIKEK